MNYKIQLIINPLIFETVLVSSVWALFTNNNKISNF